ncbi:MAG: hypothetical protein N7Q72_07150, partial [Spiroplasma sp. Tabriz.8]|nr:hypothetical protein [Spiroplasma sp. Tabriz.8]
ASPGGPDPHHHWFYAIRKFYKLESLRATLFSFALFSLSLSLSLSLAYSCTHEVLLWDTM